MMVLQKFWTIKFLHNLAMLGALDSLVKLLLAFGYSLSFFHFINSLG